MTEEDNIMICGRLPIASLYLDDRHQHISSDKLLTKSDLAIKDASSCGGSNSWRASIS